MVERIQSRGGCSDIQRRTPLPAGGAIVQQTQSMTLLIQVCPFSPSLFLCLSRQREKKEEEKREHVARYLAKKAMS